MTPFTTAITVIFSLIFTETCCYRNRDIEEIEEPLKIGAIFDRSTSETELIFNQTLTSLTMKIGRKVEPIFEMIATDDPYAALQATCNLLSAGVLAIVGPSDARSSEAARIICDAKDIPYLDVYSYDEEIKGIDANFYPDPAIMRSVLVEVLEALQWSTFTVVYENDESLVRVQEVLKMRDRKGFKVVVRQLDEDGTGNYRPTLKSIWRSASKHVVLDCSIEILPKVLEQAQQTGLITDEYSFFITNLDLQTIDLTSYMYGETNIIALRLFDPESVSDVYNELENLRGIQEQCYQNRKKTLLVEDALVWDAIHMFSKTLKESETFWDSGRIFCNSSDNRESGQSIVNLMKTETYDGLSGRMQFKLSKRSEFKLDVVELSEDGLVKIGTWSNNNMLNIVRIPRESNLELHGLSNMTFRVATKILEPFTMLKRDWKQLQGNDMYEGFAIDIIAELAALEHFNYTIIINKEGNGKYIKQTKKWNGLIGAVMNGEADLAIADLTINAKREEAVDFTPNFMNLGIKILFKKPEEAPPSFFSFFDPFAYEVWLLVAASYVGVSFILFICGRLSPSEWTNPYPCIEEPEFYVNQFSLQNSFWFATGSIMQQGSEIAPIAYSTRMVAGMWWFFTLIMVASYTANLAAFLTSNKPLPLFDNIKEMVEKAEELDIKYGALESGATASFFEESHQDIYQRVSKYMKEHPDVMVDSNDAGVERAEKKDEKYAFFMESATIDYVTQRHCNLSAYGSQLDEKGYGIAMRKNSWYRHSLSKSMLKLLEGGKIEALRRKWWEEQRGGGACAGEVNENNPLNLASVGGIFGVTMGGMLFATLLGLFEMVLHAKHKARKKRMAFKKMMKEEIRFYCKLKEQVKPVEDQTAENSEERSIKTDEIRDYGWKK